MHGDANRSRMVGNSSGNRLSNPPSGISAEFVTPAVFIFVHRPHQPGITFLDYIQEAQASIAIFLGD